MFMASAPPNSRAVRQRAVSRHARDPRPAPQRQRATAGIIQRLRIIMSPFTSFHSRG